MAISVGERYGRPLELSLSEAGGALGDSITVLPVVVALGVLTPASLPHVLLLFGVFQVVWGVVYGIPLSVEPMKALAGLTIAGALSYGELVAAGLLAGVVLLVAGRLGVVGYVGRLVGDPVIRGVQLAVALLLGQAALSHLAADPTLAAGAAAVAGVAFLAGGRRVTAPVVVGAGVLLALLSVGLPSPSLPALSLFPAGGPALTEGALEGTAAQLAMTVGNAAVATSLLCSDLFGADVDPDDLSTSMGAMCLASVPLGGLPMCHGSGGLAGKHAFGARTGGANLLLGGFYLLAATLTGVLLAFPTAVLGVLLAVVALQLGRTSWQSEYRPVTVAVGVVGLLWNVGGAFALGAVAWWALRKADVAGAPSE